MDLPKGPGGGDRVRDVSIDFARIRKLQRILGLSPDCVNQHFPRLISEDDERA